MQSRLAIVAALLTLTGCGNSSPTNTYSTPRQTAMALAQAIQQGDAAGIKAASVGGDPQVINAFAASMAAHKALADAATARFGPDAKGFDNDPGTMSDFAKRLDDAQVTITNDTASITINGSATPWLNLKKIDGDWKADLSQMPGLGASAESPAMAAMMQKTAQVTRDLAAEVASGKYATLDAARQARLQKIRAAIADMPTTRG